MAGSVWAAVTSCCTWGFRLICMRGSNIKMASCMLDPKGVTSAFPPFWYILQHSHPSVLLGGQAGRSPLSPGTTLSLLCPSSIPSAVCQSWRCPEQAVIFLFHSSFYSFVCNAGKQSLDYTELLNLSMCRSGSVRGLLMCQPEQTIPPLLHRGQDL